MVSRDPLSMGWRCKVVFESRDVHLMEPSGVLASKSDGCAGQLSNSDRAFLGSFWACR